MPRPRAKPCAQGSRRAPPSAAGSERRTGGASRPTCHPGRMWLLTQVVMAAQIVDDPGRLAVRNAAHIGVLAVAMQVGDIPVAALFVLDCFVESGWNPASRGRIGVERLDHQSKQFLLG